MNKDDILKKKEGNLLIKFDPRKGDFCHKVHSVKSKANSHTTLEKDNSAFNRIDCAYKISIESTADAPIEYEIKYRLKGHQALTPG